MMGQLTYLCTVMQVLYIGKILGIYAYKSGRHQWLKSSDTRAKKLYV